MTELEELRQKRKEIDEKIKNLMKQDYLRVGDAKIDKEHYPTGKPDRFYAAVRVFLPDSGKWTWRAIANSNDKQEVIDRIPVVIRDLQGLCDALKGGDGQA